MKNRTLLLVAALIFAITPMIASVSAKSENPATNYVSVSYCGGVTDEDIVIYMQGYGYHVTRITAITGSCNVYVETLEQKKFIVLIGADGINGFEDPAM